jgi:hypothetical protein
MPWGFEVFLPKLSTEFFQNPEFAAQYLPQLRILTFHLLF